MCSWLCDTATNIAWSNRNEEQAKTFERLAERFLHGCSDEALVLAQIPYRIHRGEREALIKAGFTTVQSLMDASSEDVARTAKVSRARVQGLQTKIVEVLGATLDLHRAQAVRLKASGHDTGLLEALYVTKGRILEQAIADALALCCSLKIARIGAQNEGEADLQILLRNGHNGIAQVTAKDNPSDRVGLVKACSVLQQSPELHPEIFICFGRPDFDDKAIRKAVAHVESGKNLKLIPISTLAEIFVRFHEGGITAPQIDDVLELNTGHVPISQLSGRTLPHTVR